MGDPILNSVGMVLVHIPAGQFQMGSPDSDSDAGDDEKPQHLVKITKPFYLSVCEVTQKQYEKVMGSRQWQGKDYVQEGRDYPATNVSWEDAVEFMLAGATAVAVGTALFVDPRTPIQICEGLTEYLTRRGLSSVRDLIGQLR